MLVKMDHTVSYLVREDVGDLTRQLERSTKMYSWVKGEDIEQVITEFARVNMRATIGDLILWTKKTYYDRLEALKSGRPFEGYRLVGDYNPTAPVHGEHTHGKEEMGQHGASVVNDYVPARPKQRTDLKRVEESEADKADAEALALESGTIPDVTKLPPIETGQHADTLDKPLSPLEKHLAGQK